jgi:hypothetical protein
MSDKKHTGGQVNNREMHIIGEAPMGCLFPANVGAMPRKSLAGNVSVTISASDCDKCPNGPGCPDQFEDYLS